MSRRWDDSGGDYLETLSSPAVLNIITANGPYSMAVFANMDNTASEIVLLSKFQGSYGPILRIINKKVRFYTVDSGGFGVEAIGATDTTPGTWQLYGGAWNGSNTMRVILDGVQDGTTTMATQNTIQASDWRIGDAFGAAVPFNGLIQYVAIWDYYLTDQDWLDLAIGFCPDMISPLPVGFWILNGSSPEPDIINGNSMLIVGSLPYEAGQDCSPPAYSFDIEMHA